MKTPKHLYTIGYEGMVLQTFIRCLREAGVQTLIDVRELPLSRKPGFSKNGLATTLAAHGIAYAHMPTLGCPKKIRDAYKADGDWARYTIAFNKYLLTQGAAIQELAKIGSATTAALMCFEANFNFCHRTFVARAASAVGAPDVAHINAKTTIAELPRRAAA